MSVQPKIITVSVDLVPYNELMEPLMVMEEYDTMFTNL